MRLGRRRALLGVLSVAAVLVPAAGMTYLGIVSYSTDRGRVAAAVDEQFRVAQRLASSVQTSLSAALDAADEVFESNSEISRGDIAQLAEHHPLAAFPFRFATDGRFQWPRSDPFQLAGSLATPPIDTISSRPSSCPDTGFDACVRRIRLARRRAQALAVARQRELAACTELPCEADELSRVGALYSVLARHDDTGPFALLGHYRVLLHQERFDEAGMVIDRLRDRFAHRVDEEGVAFGLLADLADATIQQRVVAAEPSATDSIASSDALRRILQRLVDGQYRGSSRVLLPMGEYVRRSLGESGVGDRATQRLSMLSYERKQAAALPQGVKNVFIDATAQPRGRPLIDRSPRSLVYRRTSTGRVVGLVVDDSKLIAAANREAATANRTIQGARAEIVAVGRLPDRRLYRTLAVASLGVALPHLSLHLVNSNSDPDPLDSIVRNQGRRHLLISGGLALILVVGIIATIRGAARERELAKLKSDFVSTVSHELKTPLTSVRMFAEMLEQGVASGDRSKEQRYQQIILKESERLGLLIANLLDYSQVERGTRRYTQEVVDARDVVVRAARTFEQLNETEKINLVIDATEMPAPIRVDTEVIVQCLLNLLSNALKYGGPEQGIRIAVHVEDDDVVFAVSDEGPGITRSELAKIWQEFYRTPTAYAAGVEGTGLGLALVKRHVEAQAGSVDATSSKIDGTTFFIRVPRVVEDGASREES